MKYWMFLLLAILAETAATTALRASEQFTKLLPSVVVVVGYGLSFYFLSLTLKSIPMGIAYAVWSGIGIILITLAGIVLYKQTPDTPALIGMLLILAGVVIINIFSKTPAS
ncbi:SMR family transporter [Hymenobacter seoulensis]